MYEQTESLSTKLGDRCPLCGNGALLPSPSGMNFVCHACKRIIVLSQPDRPDARPYATGPRRIQRRHKRLL
jgi:uncharacterized protein (DUF983 family)